MASTPALIVRLAENLRAAGHDRPSSLGLAASTCRALAEGALSCPDALRVRAELALAEARRDPDLRAACERDGCASLAELAAAADAARHRLTLAEGLMLTLNGDGAGKSGAVATARAVAAGGKASLSLERGDATGAELSAAKLLLETAMADDHALSLLEAPGEVAAAHAAVRRSQKAKGRGGKPPKQPEQPEDQEFERKHPRGRGGKWIKKGQGTVEQPDQQVRQLQNRLRSLGFPVESDGAFGPLTERALKEFQAKSNLPQSGQVDPATTDALRRGGGAGGGGSASGGGGGGYGAEYAGEQGRAARERQNFELAGDANLDRTGKQNERGQDINSKGEVIKKKGSRRRRGDGDGDGDGGSSERRSERRQRNGRSSGGDVLFKGLGMGERVGDKRVRDMQAMLDDLGFDLGPAGVDGRFGPATERALKNFQRRYGLKSDGIFGIKSRRVANRQEKRRRANERARPGSSLEEATMTARVKLAEAVTDRQAAASRGDGRAFASARAREQVLRGRLEEAELTAERRKKLPKSAFAIPEREAYPIHDLSHARNALARVAQHGSEEEKQRVRRAVYARYPQLRKAEEAVSSASLPDIPNKPGVSNWVEKAGGLPKYIERIAKHLQAKGKPTGQAIAIAVNVVKKMCASGDVNFPGVQQVNAKSRAEACRAVAEWERKKRAGSLREAADQASGWDGRVLASGEPFLQLATIASGGTFIVPTKED